MGREWIEMPFERDSICKLYTCGLQFKMVIFLGSSCSYNKAAENLLEITAYGFSGREILNCHDLSHQSSRKCAYVVFYQAPWIIHAGSWYNRSSSWKQMLVAIKLQGIHVRPSSIHIVSLLCMMSVCPTNWKVPTTWRLDSRKYMIISVKNLARMELVRWECDKSAYFEWIRGSIPRALGSWGSWSLLREMGYVTYGGSCRYCATENLFKFGLLKR